MSLVVYVAMQSHREVATQAYFQAKPLFKSRPFF